MSGLDRQRRCGWLPEAERGPERVVWGRGGLLLRECPKALLRGRTMRWMELFGTVRSGLLRVEGDWPAKDVDALCALMQEAERRRKSEQQRPTYNR